MFKTGDYLIYSSYGICHIDSICNKIVDGVERTYYVFHPLREKNARIMTPINNKKIFMRAIITPKEAEEIIESFHEMDDMEWNIDKKLREKEFTKIIKNGTATGTAQVLKLLLLREKEIIRSNKSIPSTEKNMMVSLKQTLINELSVVLNLPTQTISERIEKNLELIAC